MEKIPGKVYSIVLPLIAAGVLVVTINLMHRPLLSEVFVASCVLSVLYFFFTFSCLYFDIGVGRASTLQFSDIPGLTKSKGWFSAISSVDISGAVEFFSGADHPLALIAGFMLSILVSIIVPFLAAIVVFALSGGIEVVVFAGAVVSYFSFYRILRYQLLKRRTAKFNFVKSLAYSFLFTITTIGPIPIILAIIMEITRHR
jgi:hypothetical protein